MGDVVYVYILQLSDGTFYTGMSKDVDLRLKQHNNGDSISTRNKLPAILIYYSNYKNYIQARRYEKSIKKLGAKRFLSAIHLSRKKDYIYFDSHTFLSSI